MTRIRTLTPDDVQMIQTALRIALRTERTYLSHERQHLNVGALGLLQGRVDAMQRLADGLSSSTPPALPMEEPPANCPGCGHVLRES